MSSLIDGAYMVTLKPMHQSAVVDTPQKAVWYFKTHDRQQMDMAAKDMDCCWIESSELEGHVIDVVAPRSTVASKSACPDLDVHLQVLPCALLQDAHHHAHMLLLPPAPCACARECTCATDMYALGVTASELVQAITSAHQPTPDTHADWLLRRVHGLALSCTAFCPEDRPTAQQAHDVLCTMLD